MEKTFKKNLDDNNNGAIDLCDPVQPDIPGCSADRMEKTIVINFTWPIAR